MIISFCKAGRFRTLQYIWKRFKNWVRAEREDELYSSNCATLLGREAYISNSPKIDTIEEMVETRSGRHASPSVTGPLGTQPSKKKIQPSRRSEQAEVTQKSHQGSFGRAEPDILVLSTPVETSIPVASTLQTNEEELQSLPHRSRNLAVHDNSVDTVHQELPKSVNIVHISQILQRESNEEDEVTALTNSLVVIPSTLELAIPGSSAPISPHENQTEREQTELTAVASEKAKIVQVADHKRFPSEEVNFNSISDKEAATTDLVKSHGESEELEPESDDDAPEEVTIEAGAEAARSVAAKAAKSIRRFD